jgi:hypothetical protein
MIDQQQSNRACGFLQQPFWRFLPKQKDSKPGILAASSSAKGEAGMFVLSLNGHQAALWIPTTT